MGQFDEATERNDDRSPVSMLRNACVTESCLELPTQHLLLSRYNALPRTAPAHRELAEEMGWSREMALRCLAQFGAVFPSLFSNGLQCQEIKGIP